MFLLFIECGIAVLVLQIWYIIDCYELQLIKDKIITTWTWHSQVRVNMYERKENVYRDGYTHKFNTPSGTRAQIVTGEPMKFSSTVFVRNLTEMFYLWVIQIELLTTAKGFHITSLLGNSQLNCILLTPLPLHYGSPNWFNSEESNSMSKWHIWFTSL